MLDWEAEMEMSAGQRWAQGAGWCRCRDAGPEGGGVRARDSPGVSAGAGGGCPGGNDLQWCFSQVKGAIDEDVAEGRWWWGAAGWA